MNKIFIGIAVLSLIYGLITGRFIDMANVILSIPVRVLFCRFRYC